MRKLCLIPLLLLFALFSSVTACAPPYPSYRLRLTVKSGDGLASRASVFVYDSDKGIGSIPIQRTVTDTYGQVMLVLGQGKYDILIVWLRYSAVVKNISVPFAGEYMTVYLMSDSSSDIVETVFNKCYNWLPWTLGILTVSLIIGTFIIALVLDTSWKKAIGCSVLVNVPSVVIGVLLCLLL